MFARVRLTTPVLAAALLVACGGPVATTMPTKQEMKRVHVIDLSRPLGTPRIVKQVIDGDTVELSNGDRIRLVQIDAPESTGECFGGEAEVILSHLLPVGAHVLVGSDKALDNRDRYGRKLRYVYVGKKNVNLVLVKKGAASVWFFDGGRGRYAGDLLSAARTASKMDRGAWGACEATLNPIRAFATHPKSKTSAPPPRPAVSAPVTQPAAPAPPPPSPPTTPVTSCNPNYSGCLSANASDYDCSGGSGDGPYYTGPVQVIGDDEYGLDADGDGWGCE